MGFAKRSPILAARIFLASVQLAATRLWMRFESTTWSRFAVVADTERTGIVAGGGNS
jgi:hypothetical protein